MLGGHSLGGAVVTAYATWDFDGVAGARDLAGLVYIDGGSPPAVSAGTARSELRGLDSSGTSPWLTFGGIPAPFAGLFSATGATAALVDARLRLARPVVRAAERVPSDASVRSRTWPSSATRSTSAPRRWACSPPRRTSGAASRPSAPLHGWDGAGALTPITRFARMFSGLGVDDADGTEWYFPDRLTIDSGAVGNGLSNPAGRVLGVDATMGRRLSKRLLIYAFGARLGGSGVLLDAQALAAQSGIPGVEPPPDQSRGAPMPTTTPPARTRITPSSRG